MWCSVRQANRQACQECTARTIAGSANLNKLKCGELPTGVKSWPQDNILQPIVEETHHDLYIQPGTDVFQQPSHDSGILNNISSSIGLIRQASKDAMRNDMIMAASSSSVQVQDCGSTISIPKRTVVEDEDDSSSD